MDILLDYLQKIQDENGFISEQDIAEISQKLSKSGAEIYEAASSYNKFCLFQKSEKIIKICISPTCHTKGGEKLLHLAERLLNTKTGEPNEKFKLGSCQCLSECDKGPVMMINNELFTNLTEEKLEQIFKNQKLI